MSRDTQLRRSSVDACPTSLIHIKQLSDLKKIFFVYKIHASTLQAGFQGSVMERQITFKPSPVLAGMAKMTSTFT